MDQARIQAELEDRGIQATSQRLRIAELLFARDQHLTADQIIQALAEQGTRVSKATVYNTLNLFAEKGLLKSLQVDPERALFDSNVQPHYHIHVEDTGELIDVPPGAVQFAKLPPLPPGTESVAVDVLIRVRRQGS
ncbi:MAG TPA: transcriptional repressor [Steroidobacteraceae bacterium]|nr:transcriptional repressor [Steroidobacteraceae bacterium]